MGLIAALPKILLVGGIGFIGYKIFKGGKSFLTDPFGITSKAKEWKSDYDKSDFKGKFVNKVNPFHDEHMLFGEKGVTRQEVEKWKKGETGVQQKWGDRKYFQKDNPSVGERLDLSGKWEKSTVKKKVDDRKYFKKSNPSIGERLDLSSKWKNRKYFK